MPNILYPPPKYWPRSAGTVVFDDHRNQPFDFINFDGVWFSEDPRILSFCGMPRPGPEAIIYKIPGSPPDGIYELTEQFIRAQSALTGREQVPLYDDIDVGKLLPNQRQELLMRYPAYLGKIRSTLYHNVGLINMMTESALLNEIKVQNTPRDFDVLPHFDYEDEGGEGKEWTVFCTIAGDHGTIVQTSSRRLLQLYPGEIATWRGGENGTWHAPPPPPYNRMIFNQFSHIPSRPIPWATIAIDGETPRQIMPT